MKWNAPGRRKIWHRESKIAAKPDPSEISDDRELTAADDTRVERVEYPACYPHFSSVTDQSTDSQDISRTSVCNLQRLGCLTLLPRSLF